MSKSRATLCIEARIDNMDYQRLALPYPYYLFALCSLSLYRGD